MRTTLVAVLVLAMPLTCPADPLHAVGDDGTYRHEDSGWLFLTRIAAFERTGTPYTIDGNADAGAHYISRDSATGLVVVDVFARESFAGDATLAGAKQSAQTAAGGQSSAQAEEILQLATGIQFVKITYRSADKAPVCLYFAEKKPWTVKILATGVDSDAAVDSFVRALPWGTLGSDTRDLHGG
ncbi:MAG TPA: hypothetical protein PKE27_19375 [Povalibacter sp.]|uniref:hypothetical protein n=1 Tax=Povalibacter sp. TaxID=1962978 RepID=UPI002CA1247A|nr:hypothetical protein [Povalibacter sp.]HMN46747.1 hypothetical protein [Povalibacter sp.]